MKKLFALVLALSLLLPWTATYGAETAPQSVPLKVAVLTAMNMEARQMRKRMDNRCPRLSGGRLYTHGTIGDAEVILHHSGMGVALSGRGARALLEYAKPDVMILFGVSGGTADFGLFETVVAQSAYAGWDGSRLDMDEALTALAAQLIEDATLGPVLTNKLLGAEYGRIPGILASDMESYAVAEAAKEAGVPLLIIRCVSDTDELLSNLLFPVNGPRAADKAAAGANYRSVGNYSLEEKVNGKYPTEVMLERWQRLFGQ